MLYESNDKALKEEKAGDKVLKKFDLWGLRKQSICETAVEHFIRAGALYKISKHFEAAGRCYEKAATANLKIDNEIEAIGNYRDAGKMYVHCNQEKAIKMYRYAIEFYLESNKFSQAAKLQEQIGDMLLKVNNIEEAINAYEKCADLFKTENEIKQMNRRLLKVADLCGKLNRYKRCIQIFESVANDYIDNNLLKWSVKTILFKCMICQINNYINLNKYKYDINDDEEETKEDNNNNEEKPSLEKLEKIFKKYCDLSDIFASSREAKLIDSILKAIPDKDLDSFKQAIFKYDKINKLDTWCTEQLLVVDRFFNMSVPPIIDTFEVDDDDNYIQDATQQCGGINPFEFDKYDGDLNNAPILDDAPDL